jgi:putative molybdopterin biosynthesis protein
MTTESSQRENLMEYWSTKEVAKYLRLNEKKIYTLAAAGQMPATRISGKWLFQKSLIDHWMSDNTVYPASMLLKNLLERLLVIQGSDDPLLERAFESIRASLGISIAYARVGSLLGLKAIRDEHAHLASFHVGKDDVRRQLATKHPCFLFGIANREQGLVLSKRYRGKIKKMKDLKGQNLRFAIRQKSSGTYRLMERLFSQSGLSTSRLSHQGPFYSHLEVALSVRSGLSDAGLCVRPAADQCGLHFVPLCEESFQLAIPQTYFGHPRVARFIERILDWFEKQERAGIPGYHFDNLGSVTGTASLQ